MLSKPKNGWTNITIYGESSSDIWQERMSDLTDVPMDFLDAMIFILRNRKSACVDCDAEGWENTIIFGCDTIHIIKDDAEFEYFTYPFWKAGLTIVNIAEEIYRDIYDNRPEWYNWGDWMRNNVEQERYENKLDNKLKILKELIDEEKQQFYDCCFLYSRISIYYIFHFIIRIDLLNRR